MKEHRIYYYDIIKCIASYLICLSHFGTLNVKLLGDPTSSIYFNYFFIGIASAGVPLFLMANGSFLLNKNYPLSKILHRAKSFGLLYLVWGLITLLALIPLFHDHYTGREFLYAVIRQRAGRTSHLWFMLAMVYIYLLFPFVKALYDKTEKAYITYLVVSIFLCTFGIELINDLVNTSGYFFHSSTLRRFDILFFLWFNPFDSWYAFTLLYFVSGGLLAKHGKSLHIRPFVLWAGMLISLFVLFLWGVLKTEVMGAEYDIVWSGQDTVMTMVMAFSIFLLCSKIKLDNARYIAITKLIGLNTLGIYFLHIPIGYWLTSYYKELAISNYLLSDIFYAFVLMMISLAISVLIKQIPVVKKLVQIS